MRYVAQHLNGGIQQPFPQRDRPLINPSVRPMLPPMEKPNHRAPRANGGCCHSSPLALSDQKASITPSGEAGYGSTASRWRPVAR